MSTGKEERGQDTGVQTASVPLAANREVDTREPSGILYSVGQAILQGVRHLGFAGGREAALRSAQEARARAQKKGARRGEQKSARGKGKKEALRRVDIHDAKSYPMTLEEFETAKQELLDEEQTIRELGHLPVELWDDYFLNKITASESNVMYERLPDDSIQIRRMRYGVTSI